jgi:hypothetical protein
LDYQSNQVEQLLRSSGVGAIGWCMSFAPFQQKCNNSTKQHEGVADRINNNIKNSNNELARSSAYVFVCTYAGRETTKNSERTLQQQW